jgi:predicted HTH domain antitoxin
VGAVGVDDLDGIPLFRGAVESGAISKSEAARLLGVSRQAVQNILRRGA